MKTTAKILLAIGCVLSSCGTRQTPPDVELDMLFDMTDSIRAFPTADEILTSLDIKDCPYRQIIIRVSTISDKDINNATVLTLEGENEWSSNATIRRSKIAKFQRRLQEYLSAIQQSGTSGHSVIYRAVANEVNALAMSHASRRCIAVYSNLYENSEVSFYNLGTLKTLQKHPAVILQRLERMSPLRDLKGIDACLVYNPVNYRDNSHFMPIARLYQQMLQARGARAHVAAKFQMQ